MMDKFYKNPILAAYLNIVFPGLGCAYLHRWGYALLYLFWTPLRMWLGAVLITSFEVTTWSANWNRVIHVLLIYVWWAIVMWDACFTPYRLAKAHNDAIEKQMASMTESVAKNE